MIHNLRVEQVARDSENRYLQVKEASFTYKWNKGWFMVVGNLVKLVKVGTECRRVGQVVLRDGHMIWALVRWACGTACG